jgi:hypothetical protein
MLSVMRHLVIAIVFAACSAPAKPVVVAIG